MKKTECICTTARLILLILAGWTAAGCLSVNPRTVYLNKNRVSQETRVEKWIFFRAEPAIESEVLRISFRRFQGAKSTLVEKYETRVIVKKDLKFESDFRFCGQGCGEFVCGAAALLMSPIWIPIQLLQSGDEDQGIQTRTEETPLEDTKTETEWAGVYRVQVVTGLDPVKVPWTHIGADRTVRIPIDSFRGVERIRVFLDREDTPEKRGSWLFQLRWDDGKRLKEIAD